MVHGVDRDLHIVADDARATSTRCHRPAVGISERDLAVGRGQNLLLVGCELAHFLFQLVSFSLSRVVLSTSTSDGSCLSAVSSWERYRATLSSSCARRRSIFPRVKLRSRLLTALNLLPSIATLAFANRPIWRQRLTKFAHTLRIAGPLSLRKSPITLSSVTSRPSSHMTSN